MKCKEKKMILKNTILKQALIMSSSLCMIRLIFLLTSNHIWVITHGYLTLIFERFTDSEDSYKNQSIITVIKNSTSGQKLVNISCMNKNCLCFFQKAYTCFARYDQWWDGWYDIWWNGWYDIWRDGCWSILSVILFTRRSILSFNASIPAFIKVGSEKVKESSNSHDYDHLSCTTAKSRQVTILLLSL